MEDDVQLASRAQRGDREAFGQLYDKHVRAIYRYVYYRTFDKETSEDVTANVFTKALERLRSFSPRGEHSVIAWLYTIARTTLIDVQRKQNRTVSLVDDIMAPSNIESVERSVDVERIRSALHALPEAQREIIVLRVWEERSYDEIAAIVGKTPSNCKVIFSRGLRTLRESLPLAVYLTFITHAL